MQASPANSRFPIFLSIVMVVQNSSSELGAILATATAAISSLVSDHEIIVIDNASQDDSLILLKRLADEGAVPNLQVYALTKEVDSDTANWVGLENALGDFIAVMDPMTDDVAFLPTMLEHSVTGADVVFAANEVTARQTLAYRICFNIFHALYKSFNGLHLAKEAPGYRILSRRVVNFILQHPTPSITYRHLPATGGFARVNLRYRATPRTVETRHLGDSVDRGMRLLVSTTRGPMRLVTALSVFGAFSNLLYSGYVILIAILKTNVAPGWVTLSLQQSGMFMLISLVLLVLGEYTVHMARLSNEGPPYHVAQEFTSTIITRRQKLNVEDVRAAPQRPAREPLTTPPL